MKAHFIFIGKQTIRMLLLTFFVSLAAFILISISPIDPLQANVGQVALGSMSPEQIAKLEAYWGVGEPPAERFFTWAGDFFRGDMDAHAGKLLQIGLPVFGAVVGEKAEIPAFLPHSF